MCTLKIKTLTPTATALCYMTPGAAGMDLYSDEDVAIFGGDRVAVSTGIALEIPPGFEGQIRPRSGLAIKHGVTVLNAPGTIDSDYRGEVKVLLVNHDHSAHIVHRGDRIAQLVIAPVVRADVEVVSELSDTARGAGGIGSTGK